VLPGQELEDADAARTELGAFAALGGQSVVQWTPWGIGPLPGELAALSRASGVHLLSATGIHQARHYDPAELSSVYARLADLFVHELTLAPVKAGLIKVAGAYHGLDDHACHVMAAAAAAHHRTDAPIGVHLEAGTAALDVLEQLCGTHGVPPHRVILGHLHRFPDQRIHRQVAEAGSVPAVRRPVPGPSRH
jgi:phosphotriesterase-related protein